MELYASSLVGLVLIGLLPIVLANIVGPLKGKHGLIAGPVAEPADDNPMYRIDRTHANSVESVPFFLAIAILAIMTGVGAGLLAAVVWAYLAVRSLYAVVYIRGGAAARGGNLRTFIHVAGTLLTVVLAVAVISAVI